MRRVAAVASLLVVAGCGAPSPATNSTAAKPAPVWLYNQSTDEMSGTKTVSATIDSTDEFEKSYGSDPQPTELKLLRHGKHVEVAIVNPNLQFTCSAYTNTVVQVKFDDGPPVRFPCTEEATSKYGVAFILNEARFFKRLQASKRLVIGAEVFQRSEQLMHFTNPGLVWPPTARVLTGE